MRKLPRKSQTIGIAAAFALTAIGGGTAFAYWNTSSTIDPERNPVRYGAVTLTAKFPAGLAPGSSQHISYTASNSTGNSVLVGDLAATVSTSAKGCLPAWFTATAETSKSRVPPGVSGIPVGSGTLSFTDSNDDQDACRGATVIVSVTSN